MNTRRSDWLLKALAFCLGANTAQAAGAVPGCAAILDDAQRLACYDSNNGGTPRKAEVSPTKPNVVRPAPAITPPSIAVTKSKPAVEVSPERAPVVTGASTIAALRSRLDGRFEATLANGQLWVQLERDSAIVLRVGDAVTVRSAMLGSYMLVTKDGLTTRVRLAQ
jgi:hypothetical protein